MMQHKPEELASLARACLDHLRREEATLGIIHQSLSNLHSTLRIGDMKSLESAAGQYAQVAAQFEGIGRVRDSFRRGCAVALGLTAEETTLSRIVERMPPPWSNQIRDAQHRLRESSVITQNLARRTSAILACCRSFARHLLAEVCGPGSAVDRYGPSGARCADAVVSGSVTGVM